MAQANIIFLLKPGKDPLDSGSYRPISFLQSDIKQLAKVLSLRLNTVIASIIHSDQAGFIPQKSMVINLRRLYLHMQSNLDNSGDRALLSLDAHKAFDSIEWDYLWATMEKFGFGQVFLSLVNLLYSSPQAGKGRLSPSFPLHRGTHQGEIAILFAISIELLAAMIRANTSISGFQYGDRQNKIMLYADDTIFLLGGHQYISADRYGGY